MAEGIAVYLDSNVSIHALEREPEEAEAAQIILREAENGKLRAFTSELTLAEVLIRPERENLRQLKRAYLELFGPRRFVDLRPVSRNILIESVRYRAIAHPGKMAPDETRRNFLPDAIHVVTAIDVGVPVFVTTDRRIRLPVGMEMIRQDQEGVRALLQR